MHELLNKISSYGIVPVINIDDPCKAVSLANALCDGGLPVAEVTFHTPQAADAIADIAKEVPRMIVGAGTVITPEQVDDAVDAGAQFIVSPSLNHKVVAKCAQRGVPIIPGVSSPSDIEVALELGLEVLKVFPAGQLVDIAFIKSVSAQYSAVKLIPTGGINAQNLNDYLSIPQVLACSGSWMAKPELIEAGDFAAITALTREAFRNMLGFELGHVGINCENEAQAQDAARLLCSLFGFSYKPGNSSVFAGGAVECMKTSYLGQHGHIAIKTNSVDRAFAYLSACGVKFNESTRKTDTKGVTKAIYLTNEIGGFAIHLILQNNGK